MVMVSLTLTNGRGFESCYEYGTTLKFVVNIHFLNGLIECKELITEFDPVR